MTTQTRGEVIRGWLETLSTEQLERVTQGPADWWAGQEVEDASRSIREELGLEKRREYFKQLAQDVLDERSTTPDDYNEAETLTTFGPVLFTDAQRQEENE